MSIHKYYECYSFKKMSFVSPESLEVIIPEKGTGRGRNWSQFEDEALCLAWLNISQDPITSVDQEVDTFYERILYTFWKICSEKAVSVDPNISSAQSVKY